MKKAFEEYRQLLERKATLSEKKIDHLKVIDLFYAIDIVQIENTAAPIIGKAVIKDMETRNLEGVNAVATAFQNVLIDEAQGIVWGEMIIQFDSKKLGKKRIEEAFMQRWKDGQIVYLRFFYGSYIDV